MGKKNILSEEHIILLKHNIYVSNVSATSISYTEQFKSVFISEYKLGKNPRDIFKLHGFDESVIGLERITQATYRWVKKNNYTKSDLKLQEKPKKFRQEYHAVLHENKNLKNEIEQLQKQIVRYRKLLSQNRRIENEYNKISNN